MIKRKLKICKVCHKETYLFSGGACQPCASKSYKPIKNKPNVKRKSEKEEISEFFKRLLSSNAPRCEESGRIINNFSIFNLCHILPKRYYKSVATNKDNIIILQLDLHTKLDMYLDRMDLVSVQREFPNSWPIILERVSSIYSDIKEEGKLKMKFNEILN